MAKGPINKDELWQKHGRALRLPQEIFGTKLENAGIVKESLEYRADKKFTALLGKLHLTLIVSREYENLLLALTPRKGKIDQTFFHLPHPSGVAIDKKSGSVYVAATRNPNQIIEFKPTLGQLKRTGVKTALKSRVLMPARAKYFPGAYYFHDLAFIGGVLHANSVGMNGVVQVDMNKSAPDELIWWPKCVERNSKPDTRANYIQLNSIAAGKTIRDSYFSASGDKIRSTKPGDAAYPVDKHGVIFSGKTRLPVGGGLTRPHSARFYKKKLLVDNSGYGELGIMEKGAYRPLIKLPGWTRGLCVVGDVAFVGVSRILPRFAQYAPGLKGRKVHSGIYAIDLKNNDIIGSVDFPFGNQIFAIEALDARLTTGFLYHTIDGTEEAEKEAFFTYRV
jgi:uncharacterized protein (TIGR03032 family)